MVSLLSTVACLAVLIQGGYFPAFFLWAGVALGVGLAVVPPRHIPRWYYPLPLLSLWYLVTTMVNGGGVDSLGQALLPLVCTLYGLCLLTLTDAQRRDLVVKLCRFGGVVAVLAILAFFGLLPLEGAVTANRLQFTFQYVNAAGSWLAAVALLRWQCQDKFVAYTYPFVLVALLLTRSIGSIGLFLVVQVVIVLVQQKKLGWKLWVPLGLGVATGVAALATRWQEGLGTFEERLVQSYDGLKAVMASPLFGYGAGGWAEVKGLFQSYDYSAQVVHNSYVQAGVSGGFVAMLLLIGAVLCLLPGLKGRPLPWIGAAVLLVVHPVMDFTLCFFSINCLALALLMPCQDSGGRKAKGNKPVANSQVQGTLPQWAWIGLAVVSALLCAVVAVLGLSG